LLGVAGSTVVIGRLSRNERSPRTMR
jgi:hypothetical protein